MLDNFSSEEDLIKGLENLCHDLKGIGKKLGDDLREMNIKTITKENGKYKITTNDNKEIFIEDFTKIRYDFLRQCNKPRLVDQQEYERIKEYTKTLTDIILKKAKEKNEENKNKK